MKKVLLLGAGLVTKPLVRYLLEKGFFVKVASRTVSKAQALLEKHPNGSAQAWMVDDTQLLTSMVRESDLIVSLLPAAHHVMVADACIQEKKPMVTTSYVSPAMKSLNGKAKNAGILILNEIGLDPGIDHMSAMKIIHEVEKSGGAVTSFRSYCGGLPAPEANTNPWGYKFSWSPRGVVLAGKNPARYLKDGKQVDVPGPELFGDMHILNVPELGDLEAYPNRDSLGYIEIYGLSRVKTMFRGTLRNPGWCRTMKTVVDAGMLDEKERDLKGMTYGSFLAALISKSNAKTIKKDFAAHLNIPEDSEPIKRLQWLGLFSGESLPMEKGSPLDVLAARLLLKLQFAKGERDMIVLRHEFLAEYPSGRPTEKLTSTLIDFGIPNGDSAMSRTVALPAAIAVRLILEGKINATGVHVPTSPVIYKPVLKELHDQGIKFKDTREELKVNA